MRIIITFEQGLQVHYFHDARAAITRRHTYVIIIISNGHQAKSMSVQDCDVHAIMHVPGATLLLSLSLSHSLSPV